MQKNILCKIDFPVKYLVRQHFCIIYVLYLTISKNVINIFFHSNIMNDRICTVLKRLNEYISLSIIWQINDKNIFNFEIYINT